MVTFFTLHIDVPNFQLDDLACMLDEVKKLASQPPRVTKSDTEVALENRIEVFSGDNSWRYRIRHFAHDRTGSYPRLVDSQEYTRQYVQEL